MILYTGGKYQGKIECALLDNSCSIKDVFDFSEIKSNDEMTEKVAEYKVWYHLEEYIRILANSGMDTISIVNLVKELVDSSSPEIVIISEVGGGVIPMENQDVNFREAAGQLSIYLASKSEEVFRVICGLKMKIK